MNLPLQLRRRATAGAVTALFLPDRDVDRLLRLCSRLGLDPAGRAFLVEGGLLLTLDRPASRPLPGAIRLTTLSPNVFLPPDADLSPALLDDEARGLGRDRGLVFLPWGRVLGFDPRAPLGPEALVVAEPVASGRWRAFPQPVRIAARIEEIEVVLPGESPESVLESGGDAVGTEPAGDLDPSGNPDARAGSAEGVRRAMSWLGSKLGLEALGKLGGDAAGWIRRATPRLSEQDLKKQEATLLALLREFREGDLEHALRRALPLGGSGGPRGARLETGDRLPTRDFSYSLGNLLDPDNRKPPAVWLSGREVLEELGREYRKAAEHAQKDGDYRRAALIYGKLLRDYRSAVLSLQSGGLHHDAAVLLLNRLDDPRGAARAFEAAGELDLAVRLYRRAGDRLEAAELLRRMGEDDAALAEYRLAARKLLESGEGHLAAGRLLAAKAGRPDLALEQFRNGWAVRPRANALPCLMEALSLHAEQSASRPIVELLDEADVYLAPHGTNEELARFYSFVARLAGRETMTALRDDLRDRALRGLAARLRAEAKPGVPPGRIATALFLQPGLWDADVIGDADFAVKAATKLPPVPLAPESAPGREGRIQIGKGIVTAVCASAETDEIFIGFDGGEVFCFRPDKSEVVHVASYNLPVASLAASADGGSLVLLRAGSHQLGTLSTYAKAADGSYRVSLGMTIDDLSQPWVTPLARIGDEELMGLWDGHELYFKAAANLNARGSMTLPRPDAAPPTALLLPWSANPDEEFAVLIHDGREWCLVEPSGRPRHATGLVWRPSPPERNTLRSVPLSWNRNVAHHLELVGLGGYGTLHWATLQSEDGRLDLVAQNSAAREGGYLAACLVRSQMVAGVTGKQVEWLRCGADRFSLASSTEIELGSAVACFASRRTRELLVVSADGELARVRIPV